MGVEHNRAGPRKLSEPRFEVAPAKDAAPAARLFGAGTDSLAGKLDGVLDRLLDDDGLLDSRSDGLDARSRTLRKQRDALDFRMTQAESRYRTQFTALDAMVTKLQGTSDFLSQQLSRL